jgi:hypothetical protein
MSFVFSRKGRKAMKAAFSVLAVLIAISMILLYAPGLFNLF